MATIIINGKPCSSKWDKGETVGRLLITHTPVHRPPRRPKGRHIRKQWYYQCRCSCGREDVEKSQEALQTSRTMCHQCAIASREDSRPQGWYGVAPPEGAPNFATLRLVSDEMLTVLEAAK